VGGGEVLISVEVPPSHVVRNKGVSDKLFVVFSLVVSEILRIYC